MNKELLSEVKKTPQSAGRTYMIKYLEGGKLSAGQAIKAACFCCEGYYLDGKVDCELPDCPLYPFMQYNKNKQKSRVVSEETKKKMSTNLKKRRAKK
jgi:hypothetical protein